jgi:hypothetical protein
MSRPVADVLRSGYLTPAERAAIYFEKAIEDAEDTMGEGAALALACERVGIEIDEYAELLIEIPDGEWWLVEHLPVLDKEATK